VRRNALRRGGLLDTSESLTLDEDYLILSTIHSAKGQEWKVVFVLNFVDGCIPRTCRPATPTTSRRSAACCTSP